MKQTKTIYNMKYYFITICFLFLSITSFSHKALAADPNCVSGPDGYCMLAPLEGVSDTTGRVNLNTYIPAMFKLAIGIAGALAVLRIIIGGIKYMTTDAFGEKGDAKETIRNALIGLLLAISAYTILYTVNPKLVNFDFSIEGLKVGPAIDTGLGAGVERCPDGSPIQSGPVKCIGGISLTRTCKILPAGSPEVSCACINCTENPEGLRFGLNTNKYLNSNLAAKLNSVEKSIGGGWQITEAWPPIVPHQSLCHRDGSCVDINFMHNKYISGSSVTIEMVTRVINLGKALSKEGLKVYFELSPSDIVKFKNARGSHSQKDLDDVLRNAGVGFTAPHFHVIQP